MWKENFSQEFLSPSKPYCYHLILLSRDFLQVKVTLRDYVAQKCSNPINNGTFKAREVFHHLSLQTVKTINYVKIYGMQMSSEQMKTGGSFLPFSDSWMSI